MIMLKSGDRSLSLISKSKLKDKERSNKELQDDAVKFSDPYQVEERGKLKDQYLMMFNEIYNQ